MTMQEKIDEARAAGREVSSIIAELLLHLETMVVPAKTGLAARFAESSPSQMQIADASNSAILRIDPPLDFSLPGKPAPVAVPVEEPINVHTVFDGI